MLMLDPKTFTGISSGILSMRKNVMAVRKTILKNKTTNQRLKTKTELANKRLQETRSKNEKEKSNEQKRNLGKKLKATTSNVFKRPELAFGIPGIGALGSVITFFSVVLLGWMLKALPKIKKAVEDFIKRAKTLIDQLGSFLNGIKKFFVAIFSALELMYKKLGFGGQDSLKPEDVKDTKDKLGEAKDALSGFITNFPQHIATFTRGLAELFEKDYKKNRKGEGVAGTSGYTGDSPSGAGGGGNFQPLLDYIAKYEAVDGSYDSIYPGRTYPGLSKMTIGEADKWQERTASQRGSAAAGRYQFMEIKKQAAAAGLSPSDIFSPENQDKMAVALITQKRGITEAMIKSNPNEAMIRLGMEWAALPMPVAMKGHSRYVQAGQSYYAGDGLNKAGATVAETQAVLSQVTFGTAPRRVKYPTAAETNAQKSSVFEPVRSNQERETFLSQSGGPKKISIDKDVVIPIQLNRSTKEDYDQAFAAADSISITSVDGDSVYEDLIGG